MDWADWIEDALAEWLDRVVEVNCSLGFYVLTDVCKQVGIEPELLPEVKIVKLGQQVEFLSGSTPLSSEFLVLSLARYMEDSILSCLAKRDEIQKTITTETAKEDLQDPKFVMSVLIMLKLWRAKCHSMLNVVDRLAYQALDSEEPNSKIITKLKKTFHGVSLKQVLQRVSPVDLYLMSPDEMNMLKGAILLEESNVL